MARREKGERPTTNLKKNGRNQDGEPDAELSNVGVKGELSDSEREELERHVYTLHNAAIYLRLKSNYNDREVLEFFRLYREQIIFIEGHKHQTFLVRDHLQTLKLDERQLDILSDGLSRWFPDNIGVIEFRKQIVDRIDDLRLKDESESTSNMKVNKAEDKWNPANRGLTIDRAIMLMYPIGGSRIKGLDLGRVAVAIEFLTGFDRGEISKRFSQVLPDPERGIKKFNHQTKAYNRDVEVVSRVLSEMGLADEAERLRQDSGE